MNICFKNLYKVASILDLVDCTAKAIKIRKVNSQTFSAKLNYNAFHLMKKKSSSSKKHKVVKLNAIDVVSKEEKDVRMYKFQAKQISNENAECEMKNEAEMVSSLVIESKLNENAECEPDEHCLESRIDVNNDSIENRENVVGNQKNLSVSDILLVSKEYDESFKMNLVKSCLPIIVEDNF